MKKLICFAALMFLLKQSSMGQQPTRIGIHGDIFGYYEASHTGSGWCWAASLQMIFNYYGISVSQEEIFTKSFGNLGGDNFSNWADSLQMIESNLKNWSFNRNGSEYKIKAKLTMGAPTPMFLIDELTNLRPVLIGYKTGYYSVRILVITACTYTENQFGPQIQMIEVSDPYPSKQNLANIGKSEHLTIDWEDVIKLFWYIRIKS